MALLDTFYTNPPKLTNFYPRKLQLPLHSNFALFGARGVGKSALVIEYARTLTKPYLYIDCQDPAFILEDLEIPLLNAFIKEESIYTVIFDHYFEGFLDALPNVAQTIIVTHQSLKLAMPSFRLKPLDFEEFFNFHKSYNLTHSFDLYSKLGSLPQIAKAPSSTLASRELFYERFDMQEGKVLLILALFQGRVTTPHQIYQRAREYFKISKDWLYRAIEQFVNEGILYQIPTLQRGFGKKLFLYDFIFSKYLNKNQNFLTSFDTLVALALIKHNIEVKAITTPLSYLTDNHHLIVIAPFDGEEQLWKRVQNSFAFYSNLQPKSVQIVTVNSSYQFSIKNITFSAQPFFEWVVGLE